jgi:hypothetical protein
MAKQFIGSATQNGQFPKRRTAVRGEIDEGPIGGWRWAIVARPPIDCRPRTCLNRNLAPYARKLGCYCAARHFVSAKTKLSRWSKFGSHLLDNPRDHGLGRRPLCSNANGPGSLTFAQFKVDYRQIRQPRKIAQNRVYEKIGRSSKMAAR